jgi:hypothetical protein
MESSHAQLSVPFQQGSLLSVVAKLVKSFGFTQPKVLMTFPTVDHSFS